MALTIRRVAIPSTYLANMRDIIESPSLDGNRRSPAASTVNWK